MSKKDLDLNPVGWLLLFSVLVAAVVLNIYNIIAVIHGIAPASVTTHQIILAILWGVVRFFILKVGVVIGCILAVAIGSI